MDILKVGIEIDIKKEDNFLKILETLTRIGIASEKEGSLPKLFQSCHILHKRNKYYIVHFKEMFILDGKATTLDSSDIERRDFITKLLEDWGLLTIIDESFDRTKLVPDMKLIKVIPFSQKKNWNLIQKYTIGGK